MRYLEVHNFWKKIKLILQTNLLKQQPFQVLRIRHSKFLSNFQVAYIQIFGHPGITVGRSFHQNSPDCEFESHLHGQKLNLLGLIKFHQPESQPVSAARVWQGVRIVVVGPLMVLKTLRHWSKYVKRSRSGQSQRFIHAVTRQFVQSIQKFLELFLIFSKETPSPNISISPAG